jgi:putative transposase
MIRTDAQLSVSRFAELIGVPRRTYTWRLARHRHGDPVRGRWPAPVVDRIEPLVAKYAGDWPAWGHRKVHAIMRVDGHPVGSASSVARAMARRDLLQPVTYQAERRQLAKARKASFIEAPPTRRNRLWQADFSAFETACEGTWQLGGVVDYVAKLALACPVTATQTAPDLCAAFDAAEARVEELLGISLFDDCVDPTTGEIFPVIVVTDNGPAMKAVAVAKWFAARPHFEHVRTRHRSPHTNGVVERWFQSLKYERLYRHDIDDAADLARHVDEFIDEYNHTRPHEAISFDRPITRYLAAPTTQAETDPNSARSLTRDTCRRYFRTIRTWSLGRTEDTITPRGAWSTPIMCSDLTQWRRTYPWGGA